MPLKKLELYDLTWLSEKDQCNTRSSALQGVGGNKRGRRNTGVGTIFTPGGQAKQARGRPSRQGHKWWDTSQSKSITCEGHQWQPGSEMGSPRTYIFSFLVFLSIINLLAAQEVKSKTESHIFLNWEGGVIRNVLTNPHQVGPRRRLVRRRKNLPPAPQHQIPPQPQLPQSLLKPDSLSNDSQHLKVLSDLLLLLLVKDPVQSIQTVVQI